MYREARRRRFRRLLLEGPNGQAQRRSRRDAVEINHVPERNPVGANEARSEGSAREFFVADRNVDRT
ncbi:hypothetical protein AS156_19790 [Bradyrhizobium macuxiense]|uniref:Uncharacterized protein n=1 Tax=Bradyrhizobium macuxiense TaxID=1755647 RepID=A0A120FIK7_9BRAD|nr:hypothetical protein AS156_19790 [Bradyrhizobium macuxiense]